MNRDELIFDQNTRRYDYIWAEVSDGRHSDQNRYVEYTIKDDTGIPVLSMGVTIARKGPWRIDVYPSNPKMALGLLLRMAQRFIPTIIAAVVYLEHRQDFKDWLASPANDQKIQWPRVPSPRLRPHVVLHNLDCTAADEGQ